MFELGCLVQSFQFQLIFHSDVAEICLSLLEQWLPEHFAFGHATGAEV